MLRKLAAYRRQNQLDFALQELGRIERTLFMLGWVHARLARKPGIAPTLPCRAQQERAASFPRAGHLHLQTRPANKAGKQGRIADRSAEAQQFRASGLNLVIAAIVFWNSTYIADAIAHLRATEQSVPDALLPRSAG